MLGHQYQARLLEAERLRDPERREARRRESETRYREPALAYLRQSEGAEVPSTAYGAALLEWRPQAREELSRALAANRGFQREWAEVLQRLQANGPG